MFVLFLVLRRRNGRQQIFFVYRFRIFAVILQRRGLSVRIVKRVDYVFRPRYRFFAVRIRITDKSRFGNRIDKRLRQIFVSCDRAFAALPVQTYVVKINGFDALFGYILRYSDKRSDFRVIVAVLRTVVYDRKPRFQVDRRRLCFALAVINVVRPDIYRNRRKSEELVQRRFYFVYFGFQVTEFFIQFRKTYGFVEFLRFLFRSRRGGFQPGEFSVVSFFDRKHRVADFTFVPDVIFDRSALRDEFGLDGGKFALPIRARRAVDFFRRISLAVLLAEINLRVEVHLAYVHLRVSVVEIVADFLRFQEIIRVKRFAVSSCLFNVVTARISVVIIFKRKAIFEQRFILH